jgi:hypothetical protein
MPSISLTDFVDFVVATGTSKLTKVRQIKRRPQYHPAFDHWKSLVLPFGCKQSETLYKRESK